jgi:DNA-binding CsgD family transcriptional regulator
MHITRLDAALAGVLLLVSQVEVWAFGRLGGTAAAAGIAGLAALLMLWRSYRPLELAVAECALFAFAAQVSLAQDVEPLSATFTCILVTTWFTLGHLTNRVRAVIGLAIGLAFGLFATNPFRLNIYLALVLTTFVVPWLIGSLWWMRNQSSAERERLQSAEGLNVARLSANPTALQQLTPREAEVLQLMVEGLSNSEMAARLVVSLPTVKSHVASILRKLGVRDRTQAVVVALSHPRD